LVFCRDELQESIYNREAINAAAVANGGALVNELYWSSTEANNNLHVGFKDGGTYSSFKNYISCVLFELFKAVTEA
jgi:hypothetical protein